MERREEETIPNDSDPLLERKNEGAEPSSQLSPPQPATVIALEIEDEETDDSSAACCRICLEAESEIGDELISPCMCKGTQQFVHRSCLDHWRSVKILIFQRCTSVTGLDTGSALSIRGRPASLQAMISQLDLEGTV